MKKTLQSGILSVAVISLLVSGVANAMITRQLDFGNTGSQVSELQQHLSTDINVYPSRLVTGYFGLLTQGGVRKFQVREGIVSSGSPSTTGYGRVGPMTMARINALMGGGNQVSWDAVPVLSTPSVSVTRNSATVAWATNEDTVGQIYYDTAPLRADEAADFVTLPYVSGTLVSIGGGYQINNAATIQGLQANTTYYFLVRSIDRSGNMSMTLPMSFRTAI